MKRPIETALWCDCETTEDKILFLQSGRAWETGIISKEMALAFLDALYSLKAHGLEAAKGEK